MRALYEARATCALSLALYGLAIISLVCNPAWPYGAFWGLTGTFLLLVGLRQGAKARRRIEKERTAARRQRRANA